MNWADLRRPPANAAMMFEGKGHSFFIHIILPKGHRQLFLRAGNISKFTIQPIFLQSYFYESLS
jgi:hypothetical protein